MLFWRNNFKLLKYIGLFYNFFGIYFFVNEKLIFLRKIIKKFILF